MVVGVSLWICSLSEKRESINMSLIFKADGCGTLIISWLIICARMLVGCQDDPQYRQHTIERERRIVNTHTHNKINS